MSELDDAKKKAASTYNTASDFYDHPANTFWSRYGRQTVERLRFVAGERVLDVCCGSGASAIPAAESVGPGGSVIGVDLAERLSANASASRTSTSSVAPPSARLNPTSSTPPRQKSSPQKGTKGTK